MTGGFNTNVRGIVINIKATLDKYGKKDGIYTRDVFEKYLLDIGLDDKFRDDMGQVNPINDGYVISFDFDSSNEAYGMITTGSWEYQNWVAQYWTKNDLDEQKKFINSKFLSKKHETNLRKKWEKRFVLLDKFAITTIGCEWANRFYESKNKKQRGGSSNSNSDIIYIDLI